MEAFGAILFEAAVRGGRASVVEWVVTLPSYQVRSLYPARTKMLGLKPENLHPLMYATDPRDP